MDPKQAILAGKTSLGIELGSTRIKAVLIGDDYAPLASGGHDWENRRENGIWTYRLEDVWAGLRESFTRLAAAVRERYGLPLEKTGAIGISAMMHGYLAFDKNARALVPFRTWRNTTTEKAAAELTARFGFNIPQRWSIAHLYQAILNREEHVRNIAFLTTLAGYVHWKLTGKKVLGVGDASGMFPVETPGYGRLPPDAASAGENSSPAGGKSRYREAFCTVFDGMAGGFGGKLTGILPAILGAGEDAGVLSPEGAALLDPSGTLRPGIPLCPPEGDAGTGMVATNSVAARTGNVSAGTSLFAMAVLEKELSRLYPEIDLVTTPAGKPVAMAHCNNGTSDIDAWERLFEEVSALSGTPLPRADLYDALYQKALEAEPDGGGLLAYNYFSGEPVTGCSGGRPLLIRTPESRFTLPNIMRALLFSSMATLKIGMNILTEKEGVALDRLYGHGGLFKTKGVGQRIMASALEIPVAVMESAAEGGAWGIALLAAYRRQNTGEALETFLENRVFAGKTGETVPPDREITAGFRVFMKRYTAGLAVEQAAVDNLT